MPDRTHARTVWMARWKISPLYVMSAVAIVAAVVALWLAVSRAQDARALAQQVSDECSTGQLSGPLCERATEVVEQIPGPAGTPGIPGRPGLDSTIPGPAGTPGVNGIDGKDGRDGVDGAPGRDGVDGVDGQDGAPGADSQVPGPASPPGQPPAGWTYVDALGVTHVCTRDPGSPDSAPTYTCD